MNLVDANVLLYAVNSDARHHERSRRWLDGQLSGDGVVAFSWIALLAFLRLATKSGLFPSPLTVEEATDRVDAWLASPSAVLLEPTRDHAAVLRRMLMSAGAEGNLVNDAHLAALSIEHRCSVVSFDNDFTRFDGARWARPPALT